MLKKIIWLVILASILVFILPKAFFQLSLLFDRSGGDSIQRVILDEDSGLLLPPELDTLPSATNSAQLTIHGFSQSASEVELFINDIAKEKVSITKSDGSFQIRNVRLYEGENILSLVAHDTYGNSSAHSKPAIVEYKGSAPKLVLTEPANNAVYTGKENEAQIVGLTDTDADIIVNGKWVRVRSDGTFTHTFSLTEGENTVEIVATDTAGNTASVSRTIRYERE